MWGAWSPEQVNTAPVEEEFRDSPAAPVEIKQRRWATPAARIGLLLKKGGVRTTILI
jgi:hypothetical protein